MTYTFKLSRRLARLRTGALLATLFTLACSGSESAVGPESGPSPLDPTVIDILPDSAAVGVNGEVQFEALADTGLEAARHRRSWWRRSRLTLLDVTPDPARLAPGGTLSFTASARSSGSSTVTAVVTWTATGGNIDRNGKYVAGSTTGQYVVIARASNGRADTAKVSVTSQDSPPAPTKQVVLTPASVSLSPGQQQQFSATGKSSDESSFSVSPTFSGTGGSISASGVFTAGQTLGTYRVIATDQGTGLADTSSVDIVAVAIGSVTVSPASANLTSGQTTQLTVTLLDEAGNTLPSATVSWSSANGAVARVNASGLVTAVAPGNATITARSGGEEGQATIVVTSVTEPPPPPPPPPTAAGCPSSGYTRLVSVSSASQLGSALSAAQPGDQIRLASGTYGKATITRSGMASQPITLCGPRTAILDGGSMSSGYTLYINGASYWRVLGISVTGAQKGVVLDRAHRNVLDGIEVHHVGSELVHLRQSSTQDTIRNSHIHHAGQVGNQHYGEGIYVGSSVNNYDNDASNENVILNNLVEDVGADGIEAKEAVRGTVVRGNTVRRTGNYDGGSPGAIGTRGGNGLFECNDVTVSGSMNGFQVYSGGGAGDGDNNVFRWNKVTVGSGKAVSIHSSQTGNTQVDNTASGLNSACR